MTSNEIKFWQLQEDIRSNKANETETNRANIAKENENFRSNVAKETETNRHNLQTEDQAAKQLKFDKVAHWTELPAKYLRAGSRIIERLI